MLSARATQTADADPVLSLHLESFAYHSFIIASMRVTGTGILPPIMDYFVLVS
jgi:hypothetical protein